MKYRNLWGRFAVIMIAVLAGIFLVSSCSDSTAPPEAQYDFALKIADLTGTEFPSAFLGTNIDIPIYIEMNPNDAVIDSFTLVIAHDYDAADLVLVSPGILLSGWDIFNYSDSKYYSTDLGVMLGLTKITGKRISSSAKSAGKRENPATVNLSGNEITELCNIRYYVTTDSNYACAPTFLEFFWLNCTDNIIYYNSGKSLAYSDTTYGVVVENIEHPWEPLIPPDGKIDASDHWYGTFDDCPIRNSGNGVNAEASIEFYNSLINIPCTEP